MTQQISSRTVFPLEGAFYPHGKHKRNTCSHSQHSTCKRHLLKFGKSCGNSFNSSMRLKMKKQWPNQISIKQEKIRQYLTAGLKSLLFFSNFVAIVYSLYPVFSHGKLIFLLAESCFPMNCLFCLICKFTNRCNDAFFQTFLEIFHKFPNLSFKLLKSTHFLFYADPNCILCHVDAFWF